MDRKMTDNEIIKALECCKEDGSACRECYFCKESECISALSTSALDLIKRKDAEIERLKAEIRNTDNILNSLDRQLLEIKSEAIKEFAERLKEQAIYIPPIDDRYGVDVVFIEDIDYLVKEMVGDTE